MDRVIHDPIIAEMIALAEATGARMGPALETVTGYLTTASLAAGTYAPLTANNGQSFAIRATPTDLAGSLLAPYAQTTYAGFMQVKSPRMHDTTIGTTFMTQAAISAFASTPLADAEYDEAAWSTDLLTVQYTPQVTIAAPETEVFAQPVYYPNIGGISANFMTWAQVQSYVNASGRIGQHYVSWVRPSTAATAGQIGVGALRVQLRRVAQARKAAERKTALGTG